MRTTPLPRSILALALSLVLAVLCRGRLAAEDKEPAAKRAAGPLKAELVVNKGTYTLDPAQAGPEFRKKLEEARKKNEPAPAPTPKVDLTLRITNTSDKDVTVSIGGDESRIDLSLNGPGAVTIPHLVVMTMEFRPGTPVKLAPGKSHDLAIESLTYGTRGMSECAYWTEPGEYTLAATLTAASGEQRVRATSAAVKLKVEKAAAK